MTTEIFSETSGDWAVNWELVRRIVRSHAVQSAIVNNLTTSRTSEVDWYNPFSYMMPEVVNVDVDWKAVARDRDASTKQLMARAQGCFASALALKVWLQNLVLETARFRQKFRRVSQNAMDESMRNINQSTGSYENAIGASKFIRDRSVDVLLIGAVVVSGGSGLAIAAAGSTLKGTAKFQDTGNVAAAIMDGTTTFILTAIPIGKASAGVKMAAEPFAVRAADKAVMIQLSATFDFTNALVEGKSAKEALAETVVKQVMGETIGFGLGKVLSKDMVKKMIGNTPIPAYAKLNGGMTNTDVLEKTLNKGAGKMIIDPLAAAAAGRFNPSAKNTNPPAFPISFQSFNPQVCSIEEQISAQPSLVNLAVRQISSSAR